MARMMRRSHIEHWRADFERRATEAGAAGNLYDWDSLCTKLWTLEFVLGLDDGVSYRQPWQRIPLNAKEGPKCSA